MSKPEQVKKFIPKNDVQQILKDEEVPVPIIQEIPVPVIEPILEKKPEPIQKFEKRQFTFVLTVRNPFGSFKKGQRISDDATIQKIIDEGNFKNCCASNSIN